MATGLSIEGRPESRPGEPRPAIHAVSEHYFQAIELPILRGRAISPQDGPDAPAAVVISDSVARHYWPDSDPIGGRIKLGDSSSSWLTIVGVSGDVTHWFLGDPMPAAYIPYAQSPQAAMTILVRSGRDPMALVGSIRGKVRDLDANLPIFDIKTMEKNIADQLGGVRISAFSMGTYAAIALLLAVTGIYALISYTVAQRTHEIGVRMALGADRRHVIGMTLGQAMRIAGIGLSIGIPLAMGLTWLMMSLLYNVVAVNALTFGGLTVLLAASALLAGYVPARRAARIDPMTALHHE
jgi:putative ABC transport system permease protein